MEQKKTRPVCSYCGSDDILGDAYVVWNFDAQDWEVQDTFDKGGYCNDCDGECSIDWEDESWEPED